MPILLLFYVLNILFICLFAEECKVLSLESDCPEGWNVTTYPPTCVRLEDTTFNFRDSVKYCTSISSPTDVDLFSAHNYEQVEFLKEYVEWYNEEVTDLEKALPYIGLTDFEEGKFIWRNGLKMTFNDWATNEPDGHAQQNCIYMREGTTKLLKFKWADEFCVSQKTVLCQALSSRGPRELEMVIGSHREEGHIFYTNQQVNIKCSAFHPTNEKITWTAYIGISSNKPISYLSPETSAYNELALTSEGQCREKTISTFNFTRQSLKDGQPNALEISCFSKEANSTSKCVENSTQLAFCMKSPVMYFLNIPKSKPEIDIAVTESKKKKGEKDLGVNCKIPREEGVQGLELTWVAYLKDGPRVVSREEGIIQYVTNGETEITSELTMPLTRRLNGISFACFSHNVLKYKMELNCTESDPLCMRSKVINGTRYTPFQAQSDPFMLILLVLLVVLAFWMFMLYKRRFAEEEEGKKRGGDIGIEDPKFKFDPKTRGSKSTVVSKARSGRSDGPKSEGEKGNRTDDVRSVDTGFHSLESGKSRANSKHESDV